MICVNRVGSLLIKPLYIKHLVLSSILALGKLWYIYPRVSLEDFGALYEPDKRIKFFKLAFKPKKNTFDKQT